MMLWLIENNKLLNFSNCFPYLGANLLETIVSCRVKSVFKYTTIIRFGIRNVQFQSLARKTALLIITAMGIIEQYSLKSNIVAINILQ